MVAAWLVASPAAMAQDNGRALLIGASTPQEGQAVPAAATDVAAMVALLTEEFGFPADGIRTLVGPTATIQGVNAGLTALGNEIRDGEPLVVYFSGAGALVGDANFDEPDPWDEAWMLADGFFLDDDMVGHLEVLAEKSHHVVVIMDTGLATTDEDLGRRQTIRFAGKFPQARNVVADDDPDLGKGDRKARWGRVSSHVVLVEGARLGAALSGPKGGVFTRAFTDLAPKVETYAALKLRLSGKVGSASMQVPEVSGPTDRALFGRDDRQVPAALMTRFEVPPQVTQVRLQRGNQPSDLTRDQLKALEKRVKAKGYREWIQFGSEGTFRVAQDPSEDGVLLIYGPEGAIRNKLQSDDLLTVEEKVLENLWLLSRQRAILGMDVPREGLTLRMVSMPLEEQSVCTTGPYKEAAPGEEQIVPMCHRWQIEVTVDRSVGRPLEVGGIILANDGTTLGFPMDGQPVLVQPGDSHVFPLKRPGRPPGLRSVPPLGVPEHVVAFGGPEGAKVDYTVMSKFAVTNTRSARRAKGEWVMGHIQYRVEANIKERVGELAQEAVTRRRELTLNGFDVKPYLPANTNSYLYRLLLNAEQLVDFSESDGLPYAQCIPEDLASKVNNTSRFSTTQWPNGSCWSQPYDFTRDLAELGDSPGIDCSTSMWYIFTRSCLGNTDKAVPKPKGRETYASGSYLRRVRDWHARQRRCLLFSDETYRGGYLSTAAMVDLPEIMTKHWTSCMDVELRTGDMLVTQSLKGGGGHTYIVIDPERFVVFGSHYGDLDWDRLSDEEAALWAEFEELDSQARDSGVEYQFLAWNRKAELKGTDRGKWGGFGGERLRACWRHRSIAEQWEQDPTSRPGSRDLTRICSSEECQ